MRKTKQEIRAIILDLDGTLVDSREAYLEAAEAAFSQLGQSRVNIQTVTEIPKRLEQNLPIDNLVRKDQIDKFLETYLKAYYRATALKSKLLPNTLKTVEKLSRKAKLALITRQKVSEKDVTRELEHFGLKKYFHVVTTALNEENPKPSPETLIKTSRRLGVKIGECLMVGDSVVDVRAGKKAGAKTVAVLSGIFSYEELEREKPDLILENVTKLPENLKKLSEYF